MVFRRWVAFTIDLFLLAFLFLIIVAVDSLFISGDHILISWIIWLIFALSYYIYFESTRGQTLGKLILRLSVVDIDGNPPALLKAIIRTLLKFVELNPFIIGGLIGGIVATATKNKQRIGDLLAKTYVINKKDL